MFVILYLTGSYWFILYGDSLCWSLTCIFPDLELAFKLLFCALSSVVSNVLFGHAWTITPSLKVLFQ